MQSNKGLPWWGWLVIFAAVTAGALDLNWFARFVWNVGSEAATEAIEFTERSERRRQPLPVEDQ